ncbi:hypothetical protein G7Y89_g2568 [Cudoniella acicularis]|uniref:Uncharacterized protein n=1 Tax=Cudoniella acicularis TaxID=354080 RepID=A0A8H4W8I5_9HELO|nr:hypothetical protein G7Y89_g2568 [Cudoniella acicularis]
MKSIKALAHHYIRASAGSIKCVIGVDIKYRNKDKSAKVCCWKPDWTQDVEDKEYWNLNCAIYDSYIFRDSLGNKNDGQFIILLADFSGPIPNNVSLEGLGIEISLGLLFDFLQEAEKVKEVVTSESAWVEPVPQKFRLKG